MNRVVAEWVEKAEGDYATALRELRARKTPNYDAGCFHAQQCVEKYLKGLLQHWTVPFAKTHDLTKLLDLCLARHPEWELLRGDLKLLTQYSVMFRYPGEAATKDEATYAVKVARRIREILAPLFRRKEAQP